MPKTKVPAAGNGDKKRRNRRRACVRPKTRKIRHCYEVGSNSNEASQQELRRLSSMLHREEADKQQKEDAGATTAAAADQAAEFGKEVQVTIHGFGMVSSSSNVSLNDQQDGDAGFLRPRQRNPPASGNNAGADDSDKNSIDEEEDEVVHKRILIEGNKAYVVVANPWPERPPRIPLCELYKKPNPRLTPAELRRQERLVRERREFVEEIRHEKQHRRFLKGVYSLPKRLITESRSRMLQWYQLPMDRLDAEDPEEGAVGD